MRIICYIKNCSAINYDIFFRPKKDHLPFPQDKCPFPSGWEVSFHENKLKIERNLFVGHPVMLQILKLWHDFKDTRFINVQEIRQQREAFRIGGFRSMLLVQSEKCKDRLLKGYTSDTF